MDIKPLRTNADYEKALAVIDRLIDAEEGTPQFDDLDVLSTLVEKYEEEHEDIAPPDPIAAIEFAMEQRGLTRRDLERWIGPRGRVAEVLNRRRPLSIGMIRTLHAELGIPADVLIQEVRIKPARRAKKATRATRRTPSKTVASRKARR